MTCSQARASCSPTMCSGSFDAIVPPGTDVGRLDMAYNPPAILNPALRRREAAGRSAI
jgi:hypothetical protein